METTEPTTTTRRWMTRRQAADHLGVSLRTLDNLRADNDMPVAHLRGRAVRFDRLALDEWASARTSKDVDLDALRPSRRGGTDRAHRVRRPARR
jgi:excisionase family DNA binding protein